MIPGCRRRSASFSHSTSWNPFLDDHGLGHGSDQRDADRRRRLEPDLSHRARWRARGAETPAAATAATVGARRGPRSADPARARSSRRAGAEGARGVRGRFDPRGAVLSDGGTGRDRAERRRAAARARHRRAAPARRRGAARRPRAAPRGRLGGGRAHHRQADRLPRAAAAALDRPVGGQRHPRAQPVRRGRRAPRGDAAGKPALDRRSRGLPARKRDDRQSCAGAAGRDPRLGDGHDRRPARRSRLSGRELVRAGRRSASPAAHDDHRAARVPDPCRS